MTLEEEKVAIEALRRKIPGFRCNQGCTDCCGTVPFSRWEWKQIRDKRKATSLICPYAGKDGCDIYADRP